MTLNEHLLLLADEIVSAKIPLTQATDIFQRTLIATAITKAGGNRTRAARMLGVHRNTLGNRMPSVATLQRRDREQRRAQRIMRRRS